MIFICLAALLAVAPAALAKPKPTLKFTKLEVVTHAGKRTKVAANATVRSCESDPIFGLGYDYKWSGMKVPGKERLSFDGPGSAVDAKVHGTLFDTSGLNGYTANAEEFKIGSTALPAGRYRLTVAFDGVSKSASIAIRSASC